MCVRIGQNSVVSMSLNAVVSASFRLDKVTRDNQNPSRPPTRYEPGEASWTKQLLTKKLGKW